MPVTLDTAELRRRIDVDPAYATDDRLAACLAVAGELVGHYIPDPGTLTAAGQEAVREGTYQLAVKVWETGSKGLIGYDAAGDFEIPPATATAGLVRAVWGIIGPYTRIVVA